MKTRLNFSVVCVALLVVACVIASVFPAAAVQSFAIVTCAATTACTGGTNTSSGPGVQGISSLGKGVVGQAKFNSTSSSNGQSGVLGQDLSTSGSFDTGVKGTSVRGIGVSGTSSSNAGVSGSSSSNIGVRGSSSTNSAVQGTSTSGFGVRAISNSNAAIFGSTTTGSFALEGSAPSTVGALGIGHTGIEGADTNTGGDVILANGNGSNLIRANNSGGLDVFIVRNNGETDMQTAQVQQADIGTSSISTGLLAQGNYAAIEAEGYSGGSAVRAFAFGGTAILASSSGQILQGFGGSSGNTEVFRIDNAGNVHAHSFTTDLAAATRTSNGSNISTYSSETRAPTIEDFGEATLLGGYTHIRLDSNFAAAMVRGASYLVFITPQAPVRSPLYVTQKTPLGFDVREANPERSPIVFDYRIVGKRYVAQMERLGSAGRSLSPAPRRAPALVFQKHPLTEKVHIRP